MGWKEDLYAHDLKESRDLDTAADVATELDSDDLGMINQTSGAGFRAGKDGALEGFADYGLGFRFSRDSQSLAVFASKIHLFALEVKTHKTLVKDTYLKDEYADIDTILKGIGEGS